MRQHKIPVFVIGVFITLFIASGVRITAQSKLTQGSDCPPGTLTFTLNAPPAGMANITTFRLDEHCRPVQERVQIVSVDKLPAIALDREAHSTLFESLQDEGGIQALASLPSGAIKRRYYAEQAIYDAPGILLHKLYTKVRFQTYGTTILKYNVKSGSLSHGENSPPSCGSGWYLTNHLTAHVSGGVGTYSAGFVQIGEFGYRGLFDCSGNIYYNRFTNHTTVYADGTGSCQFTQHYRTWSYMWRWLIACY